MKTVDLTISDYPGISKTTLVERYVSTTLKEGDVILK